MKKVNRIYRQIILTLIAANGLSFSAWSQQTITVPHGNPNAIQNAIDAAGSGDTLLFEPSPTFAIDGFDYQARGNMSLKDLKMLGSSSAGRRIVIDGSGPGSGSVSGGLFNVNFGSIEVENLVLQNGLAQFGGGIRATSADVRLTSSEIIGCRGSIEGGGILATQPLAGFVPTLIIDRSILANNLSLNDGGGISVSECKITVFASTLMNNDSSNGDGGAISAVDSESVFVARSFLTDNQSVDGGGLSVIGCDSAHVFQSNISRNVAFLGTGGGINIVDSDAFLNNVHIAENEASFGGGFAASADEPLILEKVRLHDNIAAIDGGGAHIDLSGTTQIWTAFEVIGNRAVANGRGGGLFLRDISGIFGPAFIPAEITGNEAGDGAGVFIDAQCESDISLAGLIADNLAYLNGGGVFSEADVEVTLPSVVRNNTAFWDGGGAFIATGNMICQDGSQVISNTSFGFGGGVHVAAATAVLDLQGNASISTNEAYRGGGVFIDQGSILASTNASIIFNDAMDAGGGIYNVDGSIAPNLFSSQVALNSPDDIFEE